MSDERVPADLPPELVRLILQHAPQTLRRAFPDPDDEHRGKTYRDLPEHIRKWMEARSEDDLTTLNQMLTDYREARIASRWFKRAAITVGVIFGATWAFGEKLWVVVAWLRSGKVP